LELKSLTDRQDFMNLDDAARHSLQDLKAIIMSALPAGLDILYQKITTEPETARFFPNREMISHAKDKQHEHWWNLITNGQLDERYMAQAIQIGRVHSRIGLAPRWYIAGYALVLEQLVRAVVEAHWPKSHFGRPKVSAEQVAKELGALIKSTLLDMELALSTYFEAQTHPGQ
jgi:methyl-accepting chemotaxis protein